LAVTGLELAHFRTYFSKIAILESRSSKANVANGQQRHQSNSAGAASVVPRPARLRRRCRQDEQAELTFGMT